MSEERQRLLNMSEGVGGGSDGDGVESGDEMVQPALMIPTTPPVSVTYPPPQVPEPPPSTAYSEPPPKYYPPGEAPPYNEQEYMARSGIGVPVQIQVEGGRSVQATLVQEPSGKHVVYINDGGTERADTGTSPSSPTPPKDYLGLALFGLVFCCFPLGIIALLKSLEVTRRYRQGDYLGAQHASKQAHSWGSAAVVFGVCTILMFIVLRFYFTPHHHYQYY